MKNTKNTNVVQTTEEQLLDAELDLIAGGAQATTAPVANARTFLPDFSAKDFILGQTRG